MTRSLNVVNRVSGGKRLPFNKHAIIIERELTFLIQKFQRKDTNIFGSSQSENRRISQLVNRRTSPYPCSPILLHVLPSGKAGWNEFCSPGKSIKVFRCSDVCVHTKPYISPMIRRAHKRPMKTNLASNFQIVGVVTCIKEFSRGPLRILPAFYELHLVDVFVSLFLAGWMRFVSWIELL